MIRLAHLNKLSRLDHTLTSINISIATYEISLFLHGSMESEVREVKTLSFQLVSAFSETVKLIMELQEDAPCCIPFIRSIYEMTSSFNGYTGNRVDEGTKADYLRAMKYIDEHISLDEFKALEIDLTNCYNYLFYS